MIRFVDIRQQGTGSRFAFWDTAVDRFLVIDGRCGWDGFHEIREIKSLDRDLVDRLRSLCPDWVDDGQEDDIEAWYETPLDLDSR